MILVTLLLAVLTILALANLVLLIRLVRRVQAHRRLDSRIAAMLLVRRARQSRPRRGPDGRPAVARDNAGGSTGPYR